ncbi:MAG: bifunctional folylpolyglutamate synthase/dihydrofolate synthase [Armatimonadota bacterium]
MTFSEAKDYLYGLVDYERTPAQAATAAYLNLDRMRELLARAGDPHRELHCVHIAGTKGKGSTAAMTARILRAAGRRVGLYISPHLIDFRERMRIDDELIGEAAFARLMEEVRPIVEAMREGGSTPTFFEVLTLAALWWFARERVDIAVLETGMGGRLDATNVVQPLATGITTLALDHTVELGDTLELIAAEKAGIIKPGVPVVSAPQEPEAAEVIARTAAELGSPLYRVGEEIRILPGAEFLRTRQRFSVAGRLETYDLECPLLGEHQQLNAALAVGLAECLREAGEPVTADAIREGIARVEWPGRLQVLQERPLVLLDGAHDPAAVKALLAALERYFSGRPRTYLLSFLREKDWRMMLRQLAPGARRFILAASASPRSVSPEELAAEAVALGVPYTTAPDIPAALRAALADTPDDEMIVITGSLYAVGEVLKWWQDR